jgi:hypothetical protein
MKIMASFSVSIFFKELNSDFLLAIVSIALR